jgi:hypothetical protein
MAVCVNRCSKLQQVTRKRARVPPDRAGDVKACLLDEIDISLAVSAAGIAEAAQAYAEYLFERIPAISDLGRSLIVLESVQ